MEPTQADEPKLLAHYEGLVVKTSSRWAPILKGWEFEDICQVLRLKVWKSLGKWDPLNPKALQRMRDQGKTEEEVRDAFIFGCVLNQIKDLVKRQREQALLIDDVAPARFTTRPFQASPRDRFEMRYLQVDPDNVFGEVGGDQPFLPDTLTDDERLVLLHMYIGYSQTETADELNIDRQRVTTIVKRIRRKMADWRPESKVSPPQEQLVA